jgi:SAM-dependent methyltransferase
VGERRSERKARIAAQEAELLGKLVVDEAGKREALSQRAGDARRVGDPAACDVLERALRHRGRVERATHGFHTYPAGLHPDAARDLLTLGAGPVLDPFCGGGTVLVETVLAGRDALGLDVSPVACLVARARTAKTDEAARTAMRSAARKATEVAMHPPPPVELPERVDEWYEPHVLAELAALRDGIGKDPLLRAVFSSVLVKTSHRESDTSMHREHVSRPPGTAATLFHKRAREYGRMLAELEPATGTARVHREDARELRAKEEFGQVVTSPPYPGVYDYLPMQDLRARWLGLDLDAAEMGSRRAFRVDRKKALEHWKNDTRKWVRQCAKALVPGGRMCVVIGDGKVGARAVDALGPLREAATEAGLKQVACVTVERWDEGVHAMRPEHAALFEKPAAS